MTTTIAEFRTRFPEFSDDTEYPDARVQLFLDDAVTLYMGADENRWCLRYDIAQAYLAAHLLTVGTASEAGDTNSKSGAISSKSAGNVSVSYATVAKDRTDNDQFFSSTAYGQQFLIIRNSCFVGVIVANTL
jgi:hypothetical protein